tara:strand:- start:2 stop:241 length:240 start_codon:yes stop_codon:yes gene_type:complete
MAYQDKIGLKPVVLTKNGQDTIEFLEFETRYQDNYIQYITEYYNHLSGLYDNTKTQIYFEGNDTLLIDQVYTASQAELV